MQNEVWFTSSCGRIELQFRDLDQVYSMYHSGDCEESVKEELSFFKNQLDKYSKETKIEVLTETGGWEEEELEILSPLDLDIKLLWIAAGDLYDQDQMEELCQWQNDFLSERYREENND